MGADTREDIINFTEADRYVAPTEPEVIKKLEWFKDQKLAFMVHWGTYSQLGMCESWPISDGDAYWSRKGYTWEPDAKKFRAQYFAMNRTFNPIRFDPDEWADFASDAGFRYFIFTTKHHDGFCMFDSRYSPYKITAPDCPFHENRRANVAKELFDAFRTRGIAIAPYFSKPDWHCPWYWAEGCEKPVAYDRNPTYDPKTRPDIWNRFVEYVHAQLTELAEEYGPVDILWLDGGQVRPSNGQDIRLDILAKKLRAKNPGLIFADRTVGGAFENYITPEQTIPSKPLDVPWESCISIGNGFAYGYDDDYKPPRELVRLLINVVTRGGNLALNLGAQPDGRLPRRGMQAARGLGEWLKTCGEAIFSTRAAKTDLPAGDFGFTRKGSTVYALKPLAENETLGETVMIPWSGGVKSISAVDRRQYMEFKQYSNGIMVCLPERLREKGAYALALKMQAE
ncbi:MAG: alpha-L-fucosidase [Clostridia bacterium]|nr:alpha-L-fucosidase [Clostridia bacterium]